MSWMQDKAFAFLFSLPAGAGSCCDYRRHDSRNSSHLAWMGFISVFAFTTLFPFGFKTTKKHRPTPPQAIDLGEFRA
jgi:hypothetical protein